MGDVQVTRGGVIELDPQVGCNLEGEVIEFIPKRGQLVLRELLLVVTALGPSRSDNPCTLKGLLLYPCKRPMRTP